MFPSRIDVEISGVPENIWTHKLSYWIINDNIFVSGVSSVFAKYQLADRLKVCSKDLFPILFNFRPSSSELWLQDVVALSGVTKGRVDGVDILANILKDGVENHSANSISIPKNVVVQDKGKIEAFLKQID